jgi:hypothetical protein
VIATPEEKVTFIRQVAQRMKDEGAHNLAMKYEEYAQNVDKEVSVVRELILNGHATKRAIVADDHDKSGVKEFAQALVIRDAFRCRDRGERTLRKPFVSFRGFQCAP